MSLACSNVVQEEKPCLVCTAWPVIFQGLLVLWHSSDMHFLSVSSLKILLRHIPEIVLRHWCYSNLCSCVHVLCAIYLHEALTRLILLSGATVTGSTMTVEGCGSDSLQGDVRFAEVMGLMGAQVQWHPYSITITGVPLHGWLPFALQICPDVLGCKTRAHTC